MKRVLLEGILVAIIGAALSFAANEFSPRRLKLSRNYFPDQHPSAPVAVTNAGVAIASSSNVVGGATGTNSLLQLLEQRLRAKGISLVTSNQVAELYRDPRFAQGLVIFIDARDDDHYQAGHVPGAYQLDYYRPEKYLPVVLPATQMAGQIVVYCNGGGCEDSELTATLLSTSGIPTNKLSVYAGGMTEWSTNSMPVELGVRGSGQFKTA